MGELRKEERALELDLEGQRRMGLDRGEGSMRPTTDRSVGADLVLYKFTCQTNITLEEAVQAAQCEGMDTAL